MSSSSATSVRDIKEVLVDQNVNLNSDWSCKVIQSKECMSYVLKNLKTNEAIIVDPKIEDEIAYKNVLNEMKKTKLLYVIDTHTHADHISCAAKLAEDLHAPLLMSVNAPTKKVHIRISRTTQIPTEAGSLICMVTPGHTADSLSILWGPYFFGGDTVLYGDTGRDDLPTGDAVAHYESLVEIKKYLKPEFIFLPGHDHKGGRASLWSTQVKENASLTQPREQFISEASSFRGKSPEFLKESLFENFK